MCAEIPDKFKCPNLFETISKLNIHTPCNNKSSCFNNGQCSKRYPKSFNNYTHESDNGYPAYRRKESEQIKIGRNFIDNRWVVPYNPYLSLKYNAHINVEICTSVNACKYIYINMSIKVNKISKSEISKSEIKQILYCFYIYFFR